MCKCYVDKFPFKVHAFGQCFQIKTLHNIHTYKGLVKNPEVIVSWIIKTYKNKVIVDLKSTIGSFVDDITTMYGVEINLQKFYRAKKKTLDSVAGEDHGKSFRQLWNYAQIIKKNAKGFSIA